MSDVSQETAVQNMPEEQLAIQEFLREYDELCKRHGMQIKASPVVSLDENKYGNYGMEISLRYGVVPFQARNKR